MAGSALSHNSNPVGFSQLIVNDHAVFTQGHQLLVCLGKAF